MAIIRVSGHPAAGKTVFCDRLAPIIGYKNHYTGGIFRQLAEENRLSIEEFYKLMVNNPELEREIDSRQEELMLAEDNLIVQGRIAPFLRWNPKSKKINVLFKVSDDESARRQLMLPKNQDRTFEEMLKISQERCREEKKRYKKLYPHIADYLDERHFDIVIDTTDISQEEVFQTLLPKIKKMI